MLHKAWTVKNIKNLVLSGISPNEFDMWGQTALTCSIIGRDLKLFNFLLENGASVNHRCKGGFAPVHYAALNGQPHVCKELTKRGATFPSPLHEAAFTGNLEEVKLNYPIYKTSDENRHISCLFYAVGGNHLEIVKWLAKNGVMINERNKFGNTPLMCAAWNGNLDILKWLLKKGALLHQKNEDGGWTALLFSSWFGHYHAVEWLLDNGANIGDRTEYDFTPLLCAAACGNTELVKLLLQRGASKDESGQYGETAILIAAQNGHLSLVNMLMSISPDDTNNNGDNVFLIASKNGHIEIVSWLFNQDKSISKCINFNEDTALICSAKYGQLEVVKFLIEVGANNVQDTNECYFTAIHYASFNGHLEVVKFLVEQAGSFIDPKNNVGDTPLHLAAQKGHLDITKYLVSKGANINEINDFEETPIQIAITHDLESDPSGNIVAVKYDSIPLIQWFHENNVSLIQPSSTEKAPIVIAAEKSNMKIIKFILQNSSPTSEILSISRKMSNNKTLSLLLGYHEYWPKLRLLLLGQKDKHSTFSLLPLELVIFICNKLRCV